VTLSFVDKRLFLTVIQPVLPLHECANHAPAEPLHSADDSAAAEEAAADHAAIEPLHSATDSATSGAALIETFCLCVQV
jgi:hypothetical protein